MGKRVLVEALGIARDGGPRPRKPCQPPGMTQNGAPARAAARAAGGLEPPAVRRRCPAPRARARASALFEYDAPMGRKARRRLGVGVAIASTTALAFACVDLDALSSGDLEPALDASTIPPIGSDAFVPPTCSFFSHPPPPPDPNADAGDVDDLPPTLFAVTRGTIDPVAVPGFDLDGVCTVPEEDGGEYPNVVSCRADTIVYDLAGGADNALALFSDRVAASGRDGGVEGMTNALIATGARTVLMQLRQYNGLLDDPAVTVDVLHGEGRTDTCDAGDVDCKEGWNFDRVDRIAGTPTNTARGYVTNGRLVARFGRGIVSAIRIPLTPSTSLRLRGAILSAKLTKLERDAEPPVLALTDGVLAGYVPREDVLHAVGPVKLGREADPALCALPTFDSIRAQICAFVDIADPPGDDPTMPCNALSLGLGFSATPAFLDQSRDFVAVNPCDAGETTCP